MPFARTLPSLAVALLLTLSLLGAGAPPAGNKLPPIITITKTDGTTVKGNLVSAGRDAVSVRPFVKGVAAADAVDVPWPAIKSVSNGLTRAKAFEQWKTEHKDQLCGDCAGAGQARCGTCKGTGHDPASGKDCATCKGELLVACKTPRCDQGKVPCPKPCIKLTDAGWVKHPDGSMWRRFPAPKGSYYEYSTNHLGEIPQVGKDGLPTGTIACTTCGLTGKVTCPSCGGTAKLPCPTCASNAAAPACAAPGCDHGKAACKTCEGTGLKT